MRPRSLVQVSKSGLPFTRTWIHPVNLLPLNGLAHINNGSWSTVNKPATPVSSASQQRPQVSQQQRSTPAAAGNPTQAKANAQSNPQQRAAPAPSQNVQQSKPPVWAQQQRPSQAPANPQRTPLTSAIPRVRRCFFIWTVEPGYAEPSARRGSKSALRPDRERQRPGWRQLSSMSVRFQSV
jgi:hypothetical protein